MRRLGPIYDLEDGTRLQDLDGACKHCGKRLAEVHHDPHGCWRTSAIVCIDCGNEDHSYDVKPSYVAPGKRVAECRLCSWRSMPMTGRRAAEMALQHLRRSHV